jgi:translation initiation factor 1
MRQEPKRRIDTNAARSPRAGLHAAFAGLDLPGAPEPAPASTPPAPAPALPTWKLGRVVLRREVAKRAGKTVIVVDDFATHLPLSVIDATAKKLRQACGCGGTVRGRAIEIQGDQPAKIRAFLEGEGFAVAGLK